MTKKFGYSIMGIDPDKTVKASGKDLRISLKKTTEVCRELKGLKLEDAKEILEDVVAEKRMIPFRQHKKKLGHHADKLRDYKWFAGGYPIKVAKRILGILKNAEGNAEYKGLDADKLKIIHASVDMGPKLRRFIPRGFGRSSPKYEQLTRVQLVLEEVSE
jgi:large subunit ribosomal protein L22